VPKPIDQMEEELSRLLSGAKEQLANLRDLETLEKLRVQFLGRKSELTHLFSSLADAGYSPDEKKRLGDKLNAAKKTLTEFIEERRKSCQPAQEKALPEDLTLPGLSPSAGRIHPISRTIEEIVGIFVGLGFSVVEGPEIETEYNNFEALNIPPDHPSRESFDTFYLDTKKTHLLRSHTSPVQVRYMKSHEPPFQIVVPGRVFRPDAVDASHSFQFHQVEGLAVSPQLSFGDLKGVLTVWARGMFGAKTAVRFRPHYFPFTEPSAEVDISCVFCQGEGCRVCGKKGWLEILGCGMVHPAVFQSVGYLPGTAGFAFGMGVERIAMLQYGIEDIRLFSENDLRFLRAFS
jgi:phenylalanyl-tRNA synthetase alpha chain